MGAATSPPAPWEWPITDRIWANAPGGRAAAADDATSLARAFDDLNISASDRRTASAALDASNPVSSRALSSDALRSASIDQIDRRHLALSALHPPGGQPSSHADLDLAPSPVSLGPHPDPRHSFHTSLRSPVSESLQLNALNLTHPLPHIDMQHPRQRQRLPHSAQPPHSFNPHAALSFHNEHPLHLSSLHFPYGQQQSPVNHALLGSQGLPLSSSPVPDQQQGRKGRMGIRPTPRIKNELYKTEICRSYSQTGGFCKYGAKCQFAHGDRERRPVRRHPRYKTKLCRNYVTTGQCPYGGRCRFIHASDLGHEDDELSMGFGILNAPLDTAAPLSFVGPLSATNPPNKAGLELLSSDSPSTSSPERSQKQLLDGSDPRTALGYGNGAFHPLNKSSISVDSFLSMRQDFLPTLPRPCAPCAALGNRFGFCRALEFAWFTDQVVFTCR